MLALICCLTVCVPAAHAQQAAPPPNPAGETLVSRFHATARAVADANVIADRNVIYPSPLYRDGMWLRDAFYITSVLNDPRLSLAVWQQFAEAQRNDGNIPNSLYWGLRDPIFQTDDSAMIVLLWAYRDQAYHGAKFDRQPLERALKFVLANLYEGRYVTPAGISASWLDTLRYQEPDILSHNQGLLAVTLRAAQLLGLPVTEGQIADAENGYRAMYRADLGYMPHSLKLRYTDTSVLVGEFLSQWLFQQPLLSDEAVEQTIAHFTPTPAGYKVLAKENGDYLPMTDFEPTYYAGDYQNGGSWFLYDYLALSVGLLHGVAGARELLNWRIEVEMRNGDDLHEYLQTNWELPFYRSSPPIRSRYGWNAFALVADGLLSHRFPDLQLAAIDNRIEAYDDALAFKREYERLGGRQILGEPLTRRFVWDGKILQVFRRGVLSYRLGDRTRLLDLLDEMSKQDFDSQLSTNLSTPRRLPDSRFQGTPEEIRQQRLALLDASEAIKTRYNAIRPDFDPEAVYGLPTSEVEDRGEFNAIRLQRTVIQEWKVGVPWAKPGDTTVANAGEIAIQAGFFREWLWNGNGERN